MIILTVLDLEVCRVWQYDIHTDNEDMQSEDFENILTDQGHNLANCQWMSHSDGRINEVQIEL